jgi:hypothetical protein
MNRHAEGLAWLFAAILWLAAIASVVVKLLL